MVTPYKMGSKLTGRENALTRGQGKKIGLMAQKATGPKAEARQAARKTVRQATRAATRGGKPGTNVLKNGTPDLKKAVKTLGVKGARKTVKRTKTRLANKPRVGDVLMKRSK